jgi:hypothetical protein
MFDTKIIIVLRDDLQAWQKLNVTAFLMSGVAGAAPKVVGLALRADKKLADKITQGARLHP